MCDEVTACNGNFRSYVLTDLPEEIKQLRSIAIGIAKDGHLIVGPYKEEGKLWQPCDVDACNGVSFGGEYFYASTLFHPYTVGCWGPSGLP